MGKKSLRLLSLLMALSMLVLAGCSSGAPASPAPAAPSGSTPAASAAPEAAPALLGEENVTPADQFPIVKEPLTVRLAITDAPQVEDYKDNHYTKWLEEKSGITIEFELLPAKDTAQKVQLMLQGGADLPDAFVGLGRSTTLFNPTYAQQYGENELIVPLNAYIEKYGVNTKQFYEEFSGNQVKALSTSPDGNIYAMPGFSSSPINFYSNKLFINKGWLEALNMPVPTTTEEFYQTLKAFKEKDPNGNGKADEIPLAGTEQPAPSAGQAVYDFLINAFIYNDQRNSRMTVTDGKLGFAPTTDEWREAMKYLNKLCAEGLLSPLSFTQDAQQLTQMANDQNNILGAFPALGIQAGPQPKDREAMARFEGVAPLTGPNGLRLSTAAAPLPFANGVITTSSKNPTALVRLFDLMLSEEACLMGRYGVKGQHWDTPAQGQMSIYNTPATVAVIENIWGPVQKFHWMQNCPYISRPKYSNNVGWNGDVLDVEYVNAQTALKHTGTEPKQYITSLIYTTEEAEVVSEIKTNLDDYIRAMIAKFVIGEMDPNDDAAWATYNKEFEKIGLSEFMEINQAVYTRMNS